MDWPIARLGNWNPTKQSLAWIEFAILLISYLGVLLFLRLILPLGRSKRNLLMPKILYEDEMAETAYALDHPDEYDEEDLKLIVEDLMYSVAETAATAIGVPLKYYRGYYVVTDAENNTVFTGFRIGKKLERARKKPGELRKILNADVEPVDRICRRRKTVSVMKEVQEEFPNSDILQMVLIRNPGDFRMGFVLASSDPNVDIDETDETFLQVSYIIRSLGFMDKLRDYALQYEL